MNKYRRDGKEVLARGFYHRMKKRHLRDEHREQDIRKNHRAGGGVGLKWTIAASKMMAGKTKNPSGKILGKEGKIGRLGAFRRGTDLPYGHSLKPKNCTRREDRKGALKEGEKKNNGGPGGEKRKSVTSRRERGDLGIRTRKTRKNRGQRDSFISSVVQKRAENDPSFKIVDIAESR